MGLSMLSLALACLMVWAFAQSSLAQNSPQDYLNAHNTARIALRLRLLVWDNRVAAYARNYANQRKADCRLIHSHGPYGENLAFGTGDFTGTAAVNLWVKEKPFYDYNSNSCTGGRACGHYTQVVWSRSLRLGCARVRCNSGAWFVICSYDPPGNVAGQRPYDELTRNSSMEYSTYAY